MRYKVDLRVGCVAVIDTTIGRPSNVLHEDDKDVLFFRHGYHEKGYWIASEKDIYAAKRFCDDMNGIPPWGSEAEPLMVCPNAKNRASCFGCFHMEPHPKLPLCDHHHTTCHRCIQVGWRERSDPLNAT